MLYARFANDNGLDMVEAQRLLMGQEYRTWRMDIEDYIKEIQANGDNELLRELNTLAMRSRITRLDKLYADTLVEIGKLSKDMRAAMDKFLPSAYKDFYYHDLYDIGQKRGLIHPVSRVDAETLGNVIRTPWSGKNYSARIWKNGEKLAETIQRTVTAGMHRGCSADELARYVEQRMNVGYSQAIRLVRTELNYVENRAIVDGIKESGMKYYRFVATLDRRTSAACRDHDGHIYPVDDYNPGTNAPPLHPHCRSTVVGSVKGGGEPKGKRAARNADGKYIRVPADMTYQQWYNKYIRNYAFDDLLGLKTPNGITIRSLSRHQQERADERALKVSDLKDAVLNPLHICDVREDKSGKSQRFIGRYATINVNPDTGSLITSWRTGKRLVKRYEQSDEKDE